MVTKRLFLASSAELKAALPSAAAAYSSAARTPGASIPALRSILEAEPTLPAPSQLADVIGHDQVITQGVSGHTLESLFAVLLARVAQQAPAD
jgi:hypothetical protein